MRSLFFLLGLYLVLSGAGLFLVDEVTLTSRATEAAPPFLREFATSPSETPLRLNPPEWLPLTCIGLGGVTLMYAVALPTK
ncbi:MAG: hypothetical protein KDA80_09660 [Planctomycetaceae bacterium]|nr:hypothetical protein [Planctomycetaceae bacterium]